MNQIETKPTSRTKPDLKRFMGKIKTGTKAGPRCW